MDSLTWSGEVAGVFNIDNTFTLSDNSKFVDVATSIEMLTNAGNVAFAKYIDPDSQGMPGDTSATDNVLGYSTVPEENLSFSEATQSRYALGIYTTDTNTTSGITTPWSIDAAGYNGTPYTDSDGNPVNYGNGDHAIGISWAWSGVTAGDILEANYAYIFGNSAYDAVSSAQSGGAGGGDTAVTNSWGQVQDVGSAFDSASAPPPTTYTVTMVDQSRPVLTAAITSHESNITDGVQTISRETVTTITTPMRSVTYTNGVETSSTPVASVTVSQTSNPESFSGRVDTVGQSMDLKIGAQLGVQDGIHGGYTIHELANGYEAETTTYGLGRTFDTEEKMAVGLGYNQASTKITGDDYDGTMSTNHFGVKVDNIIGNDVFNFGFSGNVESTDISYTRTIMISSEWRNLSQ